VVNKSVNANVKMVEIELAASLIELLNATKSSTSRVDNKRPAGLMWPAEAFRKNYQICNFLQLTTKNVSAEANSNQYLLLFLSTCFYFY